MLWFVTKQYMYLTMEMYKMQQDLSNINKHIHYKYYGSSCFGEVDLQLNRTNEVFINLIRNLGAHNPDARFNRSIEKSSLKQKTFTHISTAYHRSRQPCRKLQQIYTEQQPLPDISFSPERACSQGNPGRHLLAASPS